MYFLSSIKAIPTINVYWENFSNGGAHSMLSTVVIGLIAVRKKLFLRMYYVYMYICLNILVFFSHLFSVAITS